MKYIGLITLLLFCMTAPLAAQEPADESTETEAIDEATLTADALEEALLEAEIEALKKEVLSLNRDLIIL